MPHNLDNPPKTFTRNNDEQYPCECGMKFATYRQWEKHRAEIRRTEKTKATASS